jgi:hypothetical protein
VDRPEAVPRLKRPLGSVLTVDVLQGLKLPETIRPKPKDQPILVAVIDVKAGQLQLLSGERRGRAWEGPLAPHSFGEVL